MAGKGAVATVSIDEMQDMLGALLDELPEAFFGDLSGGVRLLPGTKRDEAADALYILGEYREDALGRGIVLYYGSFERLYGDCTRVELRRALRETLRHEFRHHVEALAGVDDLGEQDAREREAYIREDAARLGSPQEARRRGWLDGLRLRRRRK